MQENKMGVMPVRKLLISMSVPIMVSMLIQALYNVVDSVFVAQISEDALTAVSLAYPIQSLLIAVSVGTGVGINSLLSRRLGEGKLDEANATANNGVFIALISGLVFAVLGLLFARPFIAAFTDNVGIVEMGASYLQICLGFSFGSFIMVATERIMQATGNPIYYMFVQGTGALINIVFDPILIFGWFGLPAMGVTGAALATVGGQIVAMCMGLYINHKKVKEIHFHFRHFRPNGAIIKAIYQVGFPSIIMQSITSVRTVGMNAIRILFSSTAVSVLGVYFKLQSFVFMPLFGVTNGLVPIVGYNFGARKRARVMETIKFAALLALCIMGVGTLLFQLFPGLFLSFFNASADMLAIGIPALRIISISFVIAGVSIVLSSTFQAVGNGILSLIMSVVRQLVFLLPCAFILAKLFGLGAVWFCFPISEACAIILTFFLYRYVNRRYLEPLDRLAVDSSLMEQAMEEAAQDTPS